MASAPKRGTGKSWEYHRGMVYRWQRRKTWKPCGNEKSRVGSSATTWLTKLLDLGAELVGPVGGSKTNSPKSRTHGNLSGS